MLDEERDLEAVAEGFVRAYGLAPEVAPIGAGAGPSSGARSSLRFAVNPETVGLLGNSVYFQHSPRLVDEMRRTGFDWDSEMRMVQAPTPASFNQTLDDRGDDAGYRIVLHHQDAAALSMGPWLLGYMEGRLLIHVASSAWYQQADFSIFSNRWHCISFAHDLTVHAPNYQRVPRAGALALGRRIREALPERVTRLLDPAANVPLTLTYFFDNDLNRYCYQTWWLCQSMADFPRHFSAEHNFRQLERALDVRIRETHEGIGDRSYRSVYEAPLEKIEFQLR